MHFQPFILPHCWHLSCPRIIRRKEGGGCVSDDITGVVSRDFIVTSLSSFCLLSCPELGRLVVN